MAKGINKNSITISRETVQKKGGIVILPLREYRKLCEGAVPTYYLKGKEAEELDRLVGEGLRNHRLGKTRKIKSLGDLD
jgi:hypothetical protein